MTNLKQARIRRCETCEHRRTAYAGHWKWPHCVCEGGDIELGDRFMEGAESGCPAGYWSNLAPIDLEAEREAAYQALKARIGPKVLELCREEAQAAPAILVKLVALGLDERLATELAIDLRIGSL